MSEDLVPAEVMEQVGEQSTPAPSGTPDTSYDLAAKANPQAITKVKWDHVLVIDHMIANPFVKNRELAVMFGVTVPWMSQVINSDAFKNKFAERRKELLGESSVMAMRETEERLNALVNDSLDLLHEKLHTANPNMDMLMKTADLALRAKGYGAKANTIGVQVNNSFVVALPPKERDAGSWSDKYGPTRVAQTIEGEKA